MKRKISDKKIREVEEIKNLINKYKIFGIVDMTNLPSLQLQRMRQQLKNIMFIKMTKKRLIKIALTQLKNRANIEEMINKLRGEPSLMFTNEAPFKLYKTLNKDFCCHLNLIQLFFLQK